MRVSYKNIGDECAGILDAAHLLTYPEGSAFLAEKVILHQIIMKVSAKKASEKVKRCFACKNAAQKQLRLRISE